MRLVRNRYSGAGSNLLPLKKSGLTVKNVTLGAISKIHRPQGLGNVEFGAERPAIVAEIEQFGVVILPQRGRHLKADADDEVLLVACEFLQRQGRSTKQVQRN